MTSSKGSSKLMNDGKDKTVLLSRISVGYICYYNKACAFWPSLGKRRSRELAKQGTSTSKKHVQRQYERPDTPLETQQDHLDEETPDLSSTFVYLWNQCCRPWRFNLARSPRMNSGLRHLVTNLQCLETHLQPRTRPLSLLRNSHSYQHKIREYICRRPYIMINLIKLCHPIIPACENGTIVLVPKFRCRCLTVAQWCQNTFSRLLSYKKEKQYVWCAVQAAELFLKCSATVRILMGLQLSRYFAPIFNDIHHCRIPFY